MSYLMAPGGALPTQYPHVPGTFPSQYPTAPGTQYPTQATLPASVYDPSPQQDVQWQAPGQDVQNQDVQLQPPEKDVQSTLYARMVHRFVRLLQVKGRHVVTCLLVLLMILLLFVPMWNCVGLLHDPTYIYLVETGKVSLLLVMCALLFCISTIIVTVFLNSVMYDPRTTPQNMFMMGSIFLSSLGIILVLCGLPIQFDVSEASRSIYENCHDSPKSGIIALSFKDLQRIRSEPSCAQMTSIEECPAYAAYASASMGWKSAKMVKSIETEFQCSGFCEDVGANGRRIYPPTLFSSSNYKISCDGMVMRHMSNFVHDLANQMVVQGMLLVGCAVAISFGMLIGAAHFNWSKSSEKKRSDVDYGATL